MAKYYSPREMKGELQEPLKLQKIKVSLVEIKFGGYSKPEDRVRHIEDMEFSILPNENGCYDLEYLQKYIAREHKLLIHKSTRPLKGKTTAEMICIQIQCRKPMGDREKAQLNE